MGSEKNISAVLLVVCPIVVFAMYFTLLSTVGDADWSDIKGVTLLLGQDSSNIGIGMAIVTVAMGLMFASYGYVRSTMTGGSGAGLANIGLDNPDITNRTGVADIYRYSAQFAGDTPVAAEQKEVKRGYKDTDRNLVIDLFVAPVITPTIGRNLLGDK